MWLESWSADDLDVGLLGAMYSIIGAISTAPSVSLPRPCRSLADFLLAQWVALHWFLVALGLDLLLEVSVLVVTQLGRSEACTIAIGMRLD